MLEDNKGIADALEALTSKVFTEIINSFNGAGLWLTMFVEAAKKRCKNKIKKSPDH